MKAVAIGILLAAGSLVPAHSAELSKTYSYFSIGGNTLDDIETELSKRGPNVSKTGKRHPGATRMEFKTRLTYAEKNRSCRVSSAKVRLAAKVILPRWRPGGRADNDTRFVWDTLASDIKRHEEQHVIIARNYARDLESALGRIGRQKTCNDASAKAAEITNRVLGKHDREQERFDRVESAGFERRLFRLLENRMKSMRRDQLATLGPSEATARPAAARPRLKVGRVQREE